MLLEKVSLFNSKRETFLFVSTLLFILFYSLLIEFNNYKILTRFDSSLVDATIIKQYKKTKLTKKGNTKTYQVLKLKSDKGYSFYTTVNKKFPQSIGKKLHLEIWAGEISFYEYLTNFYSYSRVLYTHNLDSLKDKLNSYISQSHQNQHIANIYQALYSAAPLNRDLQMAFSTLGVSHLLAISGFHLGVLSTLLFFLLKYPYKFFQNRYFPYRNSKSDLFIIVSSVLLLYLLFLDSPPSLLRAFVMFIIGFVLYDRGIEIISTQTLLLTAIVLLAFIPRLLFSLGFWLSISGVFYIFLFLIHYKNLSKLWQFILLPFWVYILMLPFSLAIFSNFSIYHPLSVLWTSLFILFYPFSIFLHIIDYGDIFDKILLLFIDLGANGYNTSLSYKWLFIHIFLSLLSINKKVFLYPLLSMSILIFISKIIY